MFSWESVSAGMVRDLCGIDGAPDSVVEGVSVALFPLSRASASSADAASALAGVSIP